MELRVFDRILIDALFLSRYKMELLDDTCSVRWLSRRLT